VNRLVEQGIVAKRRGVGMFVVAGAREHLVARRRAEFAADYLRPLIVEAAKLGIGVDELAGMLREERILS
jgi:DNA-binding transcriptional regulator YhcF (GntR family)